tara:strand:+ start:4758 stop:4970 length:213 start_codon:yes stop_codon:yes gene_type:complete
MIPLEPFIILAFMVVGEYLDRAERAYNADWQTLLDITHHGTPLKPYDWELEAEMWDRGKEYQRGHFRDEF